MIIWSCFLLRSVVTAHCQECIDQWYEARQQHCTVSMCGVWSVSGPNIVNIHLSSSRWPQTGTCAGMWRQEAELSQDTNSEQSVVDTLQPTQYCRPTTNQPTITIFWKIHISTDYNYFFSLNIEFYWSIVGVIEGAMIEWLIMVLLVKHIWV